MSEREVVSDHYRRRAKQTNENPIKERLGGCKRQLLIEGKYDREINPKGLKCGQVLLQSLDSGWLTGGRQKRSGMTVKCDKNRRHTSSVSQTHRFLDHFLMP
jgi:hypothetical protein